MKYLELKSNFGVEQEWKPTSVDIKIQNVLMKVTFHVPVRERLKIMSTFSLYILTGKTEKNARAAHKLKQGPIRICMVYFKTDFRECW